MTNMKSKAARWMGFAYIGWCRRLQTQMEIIFSDPNTNTEAKMIAANIAERASDLITALRRKS